MAILNIEIKARTSNPQGIRQQLVSHKADFIGVDHQKDTYFNVSSGRLKLREGNIENHLIHYQRENKQGPKTSDVLLFKADPGSSLKKILTKALGVLVIINKKREIYFVDNVKFHLDEVDGLGSFVEIEAIDTERVIGKAKLQEQCLGYMKIFNIKKEELISDSYSDLLLNV